MKYIQIPRSISLYLAHFLTVNSKHKTGQKYNTLNHGVLSIPPIYHFFPPNPYLYSNHHTVVVSLDLVNEEIPPPHQSHLLALREGLAIIHLQIQLVVSTRYLKNRVMRNKIIKGKS